MFEIRNQKSEIKEYGERGEAMEHIKHLGFGIDKAFAADAHTKAGEPLKQRLLANKPPTIDIHYVTRSIHTFINKAHRRQRMNE